MKRKMILFITLLLGVAIVTGCVDKKDSNEASESISVRIKIFDGSEHEDKEITVSKDNNLLEIMKENFDIKVEGRKIISINGIKQDESNQRYWIVTVNGEELNVDLDQTRLNQGDVVEFHLEK